MELQKTKLDGLFVIKPRLFPDPRGYFFESFNQKEFQKFGLPTDFVQDNQSSSCFGTVRGLHFQKAQAAQAKLVRVVFGKILDVAVDIRPDSKTFGQHYSIELDAESGIQVFVPKGFAHGFSVLSPTATVIYKCDSFYSPKDEGGILYNDPALNIDWKLSAKEALLSDKDKVLPTLGSLKLK